MPDVNKQRPDSSHLEQEERQLWRWALGLLILLATAVAVLSWQQLNDLPYRLNAIPIGLLVLSVLFAAYAFGRRREVSDLKHLLKNLQDRAGVVPSEEQLDQLSQMIARSNRNFKELIDSLDDAALALSIDGTLRTVNRRVADVLGLAYAQIIGRNLNDFLSAPPRVEGSVTLAWFLERRQWSGVVEISLKNHPRPFYFDCVLNAIVKGDEVTGASVLARDITTQREKERRFSDLFETLQEGVYFCMPDGKLLDVNPAFVSMLGYSSKEEVLTLTPNQLNDVSSSEAVLGQAAGESATSRVREIVLRRKDGTQAICLDSSRAVRDAGGEIVRYQGTLVDITEKRRMEKQLQQQEEFRRRLLESFPDLILVFNLDQRYTFISSRIRDLLGYGAERWLGKKIDEVEDTSPEFAALYHSVAGEGKALAAGEYGARHQDGSWRSMWGVASSLLDAEGKPTGVIISVHDITIEKKLEQQIIQSERLAAMGQMIGGFAHELNNPLTTILGSADLLQDQVTDESGKKRLETLHQEARRAAEIVKNLQFFARPPAPGRNPVNLTEVIERTLHLHAYPLRKSNITVDFLQEATLPAVMADPNQLMQVFLNLILNAEQAIRESRDKGTIRIRAGRRSDSVWVTFQDDGPGIAPEILSHIFDPFFTTKRPGRGTGLGLSICKTVLREHGGNIEAGTGPDGGAVFTITLPASAAASPATTSN